MKRNILCDLFYYRLLKCILDSCAGEPPCQNQGFMKYNGVCSCVCPEGLTGSDCTELDTSPGGALKFYFLFFVYKMFYLHTLNN